jgi:hypothetical protein
MAKTYLNFHAVAKSLFAGIILSVYDPGITGDQDGTEDQYHYAVEKSGDETLKIHFVRGLMVKHNIQSWSKEHPNREIGQNLNEVKYQDLTEAKISPLQFIKTAKAAEQKAVDSIGRHPGPPDTIAGGEIRQGMARKTGDGSRQGAEYGGGNGNYHGGDVQIGAGNPRRN